MKDVKRPSEEPRLTLRAERAGVTRGRILAAARHLFAVNGYGATTLRAIATEAGVAVQTIYAVYRSKAGILRAIRDLAVTQPQAGIALEQALGQVSPEASLDTFAHSIRLRWELAGDIVTILGEAATAEPGLQEEVEGALRARRQGVLAYATGLAHRFQVPMEPARAAAILLALTVPEVHAELVGIHGWSEDAYEAWLASAMRRDVLGP